GPWNDMDRWVLSPCPFNDAHQNRAACILRFKSGAMVFTCRHDGCKDKRWQDLRAHYEPEYAERASASGEGAYRAEPGPRPPQPEQPAEWPSAPEPLVYRGLAGRVVETISPHTEADRIALLVSFLAGFGNAAGSRPHALVGATRHTARIYAALVGRTSKARKGDSWHPIRATLAGAEWDWGLRTVSGLSTGEGLIHSVRDPVEKTEFNKATGNYETVIVDAGVADKRLFIVEPELARVLKAMSRQGNTLSPVLRDAWDHGDLQSLTRNSPLRATGAHISLLSHISVE